MTAPLADKAPLIPEKQFNLLLDFLGGCAKYLIVGSGGLDNDLLGFLREYASTATAVHYICGRDSRTVRQLFEEKVPQFKTASYLEVYTGPRFSEYLNSADFGRFLSARV